MNVKKILCLAILGCLSVVFADTYDDDSGITWFFDSQYDYDRGDYVATISGASGIPPGQGFYIPNCVFSSSHGWCNVIAIAPRAFKDNSALDFAEVYINDGLTVIGERAFEGCSCTVYLSQSVEEVGALAFNTWDDSVQNTFSRDGFCVGMNVGFWASSGENRSFSLRSIGRRAFDGVYVRAYCYDVDTGDISYRNVFENLETVGDYAFTRTCFTKQVWDEVVDWRLKLPSVSQMGESVFYRAGAEEGLVVELEQGWTAIPRQMFYECNFETIIVPDSVESIGEDAFAYCQYLSVPIQSILPSSVTYLGSRAFGFSSKITGSLVVPPRLTVIPEHAFKGCSGLTGRLVIPNSVVEVGLGAFSGCSGLSGVLELPSQTRFSYASFSGCSGLEAIVLPSGWTEIPGSMFADCSGIKSIEIPQGITIIGDASFARCSRLETVVIPESVATIASQAFYGCHSLKNIILPSGVEYIGNQAFYDCTGAVHISLPESVKTIGAKAFGGCSGAMVIDVPLSVTSIASDSFTGCTGLGRPVVSIVSSALREDDPTIMDVVYKVAATTSTVNVRVLAFEETSQTTDRTFLNVLRPETFVEGTASSVGDRIAAGVEHKISWKVSSDWEAKLARVKFDVLATSDEILPLKLTTIPGTSAHPETLQYSRNKIADADIINAFLWLYADKDPGLMVEDGVLKSGNTRLVWPIINSSTGKVSSWSISRYDALGYLYGKMGFRVLNNEELAYVQEAAQISLPSVSQTPYAVRTVVSATGN